VRWVLIGMGVATMAGSPLAIGAALGKGKDTVRVSLAAGARNPARGVLLSSTRIIARTNDEAVKVSNSGPSGGAGLFSCASVAGGSAANREPCIEAENRASGSAFEFRFRGPLGGAFIIGNNLDRLFPAVKPFVTNATGVATGLNADRVDGLHAQEIIDTAVERSSVQVGAQGPQGPQGAQGPRGPQGVQGAAGPPGTPLVANAMTATNSGLGDRRVVTLSNPVGLSSPLPTAATDGVDLLNGTPLPLDPGTYILQTTVHAYEENSTDFAARYALAGLFVDGVLQTTLTTPNVPGNVNTPAQASETTVVTVPTGSSVFVKLRGVLHTAAATPANSVVTAGATIVVTQVNPLTP
jgi:hypothetical protein